MEPHLTHLRDTAEMARASIAGLSKAIRGDGRPDHAIRLWKVFMTHFQSVDMLAGTIDDLVEGLGPFAPDYSEWGCWAEVEAREE